MHHVLHIKHILVCSFPFHYYGLNHNMYQNKVGSFFSQISLPQKRTSCHVAAKKAGLLCHKSRGRNKRNYCSLIRGHYTSGLIVKQIASPQKGEGVLVIQIIWPQQAYIVPTTLDLKKGGLLLHKLPARKTDVLFSNYVTARKTGFLLHILYGRNKQIYCSPTTWPQNKRAYFYTKYVAAANGLIVPQSSGRKISGLTVTQITWPQQAYLLFPKYEETKQAGLVLHKLCGHNKRNYCSSTNCPQNKRAFCYIMWPQETDLLFLNNVAVKQAGLFYTNKVATASVVTVPKILGRKTSGLIVIQILVTWPQLS